MTKYQMLYLINKIITTLPIVFSEKTGLYMLDLN